MEPQAASTAVSADIKPASAATGAAETGAAWSQTWREDYAGDNPDVLRRLKRYASPKAAIDALIAAQNRVRSGEIKPAAPGKDATREEVAQWRQANGVPETPAGYLAKLPGGLIVGEKEKPLIAGFVERMHRRNVPADVVRDAITWYYQTVDAQRAAAADHDVARRAAADAELREAWGPDYRRNVAGIVGLLDQAPEGLKDLLMSGRLADGTPFGCHAGALRWLSGLAREINPTATVVPGAGAGAASSIDDEIRGWETKMGDKHSEYWTGPHADKNQSRLRELYRTREKMSGRR